MRQVDIVRLKNLSRAESREYALSHLDLIRPWKATLSLSDEVGRAIFFETVLASVRKRHMKRTLSLSHRFNPKLVSELIWHEFSDAHTAIAIYVASLRTRNKLFVAWFVSKLDSSALR